MNFEAAAERPTLQDVAPLLERLQRTPTRGATLSCLAMRLLWSPPGDLLALGELVEALAAAPDADPDIPYLRQLLNAAQTEAPGATARALAGYAAALEQWGEEPAAALVVGAALQWGQAALEARELVQIHLLRARLYRKAARWTEAASAWSDVERLAEATEDRWIALRAKIGQAAVAKHRGNLPKAMQLLLDVAADAGRSKLTDLEAICQNNIGTIHEEQCQWADAAISYWKAMHLAPNEDERLRSLGNLGGALRAVGCYRGARLALEEVASHSSDWGDRANAAIELLDIMTAQGDHVGFYRVSKQLASVSERMQPAMAIDYRYRVGVGYWRMGQATKARDWWREGLEMAERRELGTWIFRLDTALDVGPPAPPTPGDERACAVDLELQVLLAAPAASGLPFAGLGVGPGASRIGAGRGTKCEQDEQQGNQRARAAHVDSSRVETERD